MLLERRWKPVKQKSKVGGPSFKEIDQLCFEFSDMQYFFSIFLEYGLLQLSKKVCKKCNFLKLMISGYFLLASCMKQFLASLQRIRWTLWKIWFTLRKNCLYSELFWSAFSRIRTEYGKIRSISPYSVRMRENAGQNNSEYGHFLPSVILSK